MNNLYKISIKYICLQLKLLFPFEWHVNHVVDLKYNLQIESGFVDQQCVGLQFAIHVFASMLL